MRRAIVATLAVATLMGAMAYLTAANANADVDDAYLAFRQP